jgi:hypothetical protein
LWTNALTRLRELARTRAGARAYPIARLARIAAGLAAASVLIGAALVVSALVAADRLWFGGYVSEAGVGPQAAAFRLGVIGLAVGLILLGVALAATLPEVTVLLAGGGLLASLSGSVACSEGCPLPPYESPTPADLVHAIASILAVGVVVLAMVAIAVLAADPMLRRVSRMVAYAVVPLLAIMSAAMLAAGRGHLTGWLERAALVLGTAWALTICVRLAWPRHKYRRTGQSSGDEKGLRSYQTEGLTD